MVSVRCRSKSDKSSLLRAVSEDGRTNGEQPPDSDFSGRQLFLQTLSLLSVSAALPQHSTADRGEGDNDISLLDIFLRQVRYY